jgi:23S rRNA (cytidine2498-2'-O)-methyltransferase
VLVGSLAGGMENSYFKSLASNLRGRLLQIFPKFKIAKPEDQASEANTLYCMVGRQGLYAGLCSPLAAKGYYPGGTKFMKQSGPDTISRAGAKIAEALHLLKLHNAVPPAGSHWLELGASPGGMTHELLERGYYVTAVDRAPLDERLMKHPNVRFIQHNVADYESHHHVPFDALLCDMNGEANLSFTQVLRLRPTLREGSLIIFTLKTPASETFEELLKANQQVTQRAKLHGLEVVSHTHLTYNRREFTVVFRKA